MQLTEFETDGRLGFGFHINLPRLPSFIPRPSAIPQLVRQLSPLEVAKRQMVDVRAAARRANAARLAQMRRARDAARSFRDRQLALAKNAALVPVTAGTALAMRSPLMDRFSPQPASAASPINLPPDYMQQNPADVGFQTDITSGGNAQGMPIFEDTALPFDQSAAQYATGDTGPAVPYAPPDQVMPSDTGVQTAEDIFASMPSDGGDGGMGNIPSSIMRAPVVSVYDQPNLGNIWGDVMQFGMQYVGQKQNIALQQSQAEQARAAAAAAQAQAALAAAQKPAFMQPMVLIPVAAGAVVLFMMMRKKR